MTPTILGRPPGRDRVSGPLETHSAPHLAQLCLRLHLQLGGHPRGRRRLLAHQHQIAAMDGLGRDGPQFSLSRLLITSS